MDIPMTTDRLYNSQQLISPPPEETLRLKSEQPKRKRSQQAETPSNVLTTPNPRSRKQPRSQESPTKSKRVVVQSPHSANPNADYIPPLPVTSPAPVLRAVLSARRSATPIPPYEPPNDIFTPPKEVYATPATATIRVSKSSKRKSRKKSTPAPVVVKLEMPDVDLSAPMPPPSPGDDPLLLSSPLEPPSSTPTKSRWVAFSESDILDHNKPIDTAPARRTTSPTPSLFTKLRFDDLPPSSPPDDTTDQHSPIVDDSADLDITPVHIPFFELADNPNDDGWSDSEGDELPVIPNPVANSPTQEGEGEYTGKWKEVLVRTKADPPSSATRGRMDEWGNPKSPFPLSLEKKPPSLEQEDVLCMNVEPEPNPFDFSRIDDPLPEEDQEETTDYVVPLRSDEQGSPRPGTPIQADTTIEIDDIEEGPSAEDAFRLMGNQPIVLDEDEEPEEQPLAETPMESDHPILPEEEPEEPSAEAPMDSDEHHPILPEEPLTEAAMGGDEPHPEPAAAPRQPTPETIFVTTATTDDDDEDESDVSSPDIVKITSADPRAAARAAAILKHHNYSCFTKKNQLKRRHSEILHRRSASPSDLQRERNLKDVLGAGVSKEQRDGVGRRKTIMGVRGEQVYIPGSPAPTTLPELLKEAEVEVSMSLDYSNTSITGTGTGIGSPNPFLVERPLDISSSSFETPLPNRTFSPIVQQMPLTPKVPMTPGEMCYDPLTGERMWTKEEWKRLDACLTDERLEVAARLGYDSGVVGEEGLASVDRVKIEDVVKRFVEWMGGEEAVDEYGPAWTRLEFIPPLSYLFVENLYQRTRALQNKQRAGKVAPPTTLPFSPSPQATASPFSFNFGSLRRVSMDVPDFTPIRQRPVVPKPQRQWTSIGPMDVCQPSTSTSTPLPLPRLRAIPVVEKKVDAPVTTPAMSARHSLKPVSVTTAPTVLAAPRYSHLLEEAIRVSKDLPIELGEASQRDDDLQESDTALEEEEELESEDSPTTLVEEDEQEQEYSLLVERELEPELEYDSEPESESEPMLEPEPEPEPTTIGKRVKGLLFSYLPTLKKHTPPTNNTTTKTKADPRRPGLPLPPKEVLEKPRGPVMTPARGPIPKTVHPKELVHLQQAPPVQPPASKIPRVVHPKQLVELHHVTPKVAEAERALRARARRSSGASVKDLIKGFEDMEKEGEGAVPRKSGEVRRMKSVGEWRKGVSGVSGSSGGDGGSGRPTWRP
ncbi:hypothetical protein P691DRAFT_778122 [Macrolepiota fuliginosa MF-IS2]|uniref:Uncharacterized protein n=1 Tax=Macrolepiota fuliginosa MF-IS2 TaxID=1400762 RepID=A0A9P5X532_9AGAR|nr:hypothetical protein P691DRAFT_778122 [Macrolepiota fuliginosa MF-IS2]